MVKTGKYVTAKYLSAKNSAEYNGKKFTINSVFEAEINEQTKLCVRFENIDKPLALNQTNLALLQLSYGDETDLWINNNVIIRIVNVSFNGEIVKGIQLEPI